MYTARRSAYFCVRIIPYAPCVVYLPLFTYIWVIYGVNVGKYSSTMEHMGIAKCCKLQGLGPLKCDTKNGGKVCDTKRTLVVARHKMTPGSQMIPVYETQLAWRILFAVALHWKKTVTINQSIDCSAGLIPSDSFSSKMETGFIQQ